MSLANSLFVALTNINVPQDQAREVVEALEHKMNDSFATKSDIALVRGDIALVVSRLEKHEESVNHRIDALIGRIEKHEESVNYRIEKHEDSVNHRIDVLIGRIERHEELTKAEFAASRRETKAEFAAVRRETKAEFDLLRADMKALQNRLVIQLGALVVVVFGVMPKLTAWLGW